MGKLYEIVSELNEVLEAAENNQDYADTIDALQLEFDVKVDNIACFIKKIKYDIEALKAEEKNLKARRTAKENKVKHLTKYLHDCMSMTDKRKIETARSVVSIRNNAESITITNEDELITWMQDHGLGDFVKSTESVPKENIKELIERGVDVPYVTKARSESLVIK